MNVKYIYVVTTLGDESENQVVFHMKEDEFKEMFNDGAFCEYELMSFQKARHEIDKDGNITIYVEVIVDYYYSDLNYVYELPEHLKNLDRLV